MSKSTLHSKPKKILIIEDEGDVCLLLNIILKGKEIDLDHVNTLSKAKMYLRENTPSLIFLDNSLPDGRGVDFIEYIKMNHPSVKIIMITAYHSETERASAIKNGADLFLDKPFTKEQIFNAVAELLEMEVQEIAS